MSNRSPISESAPGMTVDTGAAAAGTASVVVISSGEPALKENWLL